MEFEVFSRRTAARTKDPVVTLQKRGIISLSESAVRLLAPDRRAESYQVDLLYNEGKRVIALRLSSEGNPNPHLLRKQKNGGVYLVSGRLFTQHYKIDTSVARRYKAQVYSPGVVGFCLDDDFSEVGRSVKQNVVKPETETTTVVLRDSSWD